MRKIYFACIIAALMLFSIIEVVAQITPEQANAAMARGINLGNTLEPEKEGGWNNGPVQEYYFDDYKAAGFTSIRIPVRWDKHTSNTLPYKIDDSWMNRIEQIVDWGLERDLFIVINAHHEDWIKTGYANQNLRERFDSIWSQIAVRFQNKSEKLLFEIINEPNGMTLANVNDVNARILSIIRKTNPTRIVLYSGNAYSNSNELMSAAVPNDPYIIGYFHSYDPWSFAGEAKGTWGSASDKTALVNKFAQVKSWSDKNNLPVTLNEFGAIRQFREGTSTRINDFNSRMYHYAAYVEEALKYNLSFNAWDDGGDFRLYQRTERKWDEVKDILIFTSDSSTTQLKLQQNAENMVLTWQLRSATISNIEIERRTETGWYSTIATLTSGTSTFTDTDGAPNQYYYYRVVAKYANGASIPSYPIRGFKKATQRSPFGAAPISIPGIIQTEDFDKGGELLTYHDTDLKNEGGKYRTDVGVDIETSINGDFQITKVDVGEWLEYTINIAQEGEYTIDTWVASIDGGGKFSYSIGSVNVAQVTVPKTSSNRTLANVSTKKTLKAGEQIMRLKINNIPVFNIDRIEIGKTTSAYVLHLDNKIDVYSARQNTVGIKQHKDEDFEISLFNLSGQRVFHGNLNNTQNEIILQSNGVHLYQIISKSGEQKTGKVMVK